MPQQTPTSFDIKMYGELTPYQLNPSMSKARVCVFRKYANANGSYFTDEVAQQMVENIAGCPIVGHFDVEKGDFTSHLTVNDTKAYGFVPPHDYNFAWEKRVQNDGLEHEYACFDIVLWTDRYEEAKSIINKSQSMELNPYKTFGAWEEKDGATNFVYTSTSIYGLCVLGDSVRPCFDAACFYTQNQQQISSFMEAIKAEIKNNFSYLSKENDGGNEKMPNENLDKPLEDSQLQDPTPEDTSIVDAPEQFEEEHVEVVEPSEEDNKEENTSMNFSVEEMDALLALGGEGNQELSVVIEKFNANVTEIANLTTQIADLQAKVEEFTAADYPAQIEKLTTQLSNYQSKEAELISVQKDELIASYSDSVDSDLLDEVKSNKDNYSLDEIEGKLAVHFARAMRKNTNKVPTDTATDEDPTLAVLNRHLKNKRGNK